MEKETELPWYARLFCIIIGATISYLIVVAVTGNAQQPTSKSESTLPVRVEDIVSKSCKVSSIPQEPGKATGYMILYTWKYKDDSWPEGKDWEMVITPPGISTKENQKYRRKANGKCLSWMDGIEDQQIRILKAKQEAKKQ